MRRLAQFAVLVSFIQAGAAPAQAEGSQAGRESSAAVYASIKRALLEAEPGLLSHLPQFDDDAREVSLGDCAIHDQFGMDSDDPLSFPADVAIHVQQYVHSLKALSIPSSLWQQHVNDLDGIAVAYIEALPAARSANRREAYVQQSNRAEDRLQEALARMPPGSRVPAGVKVVLQPGCGAGEIPVRLEAQPAGARISYIPLFRFKLCEARQLDPASPATCDGWLSSVKAEEFLSGKYVYVAEWPDGRSRKGTFLVNAAAMNDDGVVRIVISP